MTRRSRSLRRHLSWLRVLTIVSLFSITMQSDHTSVAQEPDNDEPPLPSPVLRDVAAMISYALENPDKSQVPLNLRDTIKQDEWETLAEAEQARLREKANQPVEA